VTSGVEDFWEHAPCGHVIADADGRIIRVNETLAKQLGYEPDGLCGRPFADLLTVSGRILYDTHFGPLLQMGGDLNGVITDLVAADGARLPMFLTANIKSGADQKPERLQITVLDAADRRAYESELLRERVSWRRRRNESGFRRDAAERIAATGPFGSGWPGGRRLLLHGIGR
jgi:sigma-B regulation protein RsbU (phosphoserine phosphatase)